MTEGVRRRRAETVDAVVGVTTAPDGRLGLPAVDLDTYFTMRRTAPEQRGGFRAWVTQRDGGSRRHTLAEWDRLRAEYGASPM